MTLDQAALSAVAPRRLTATLYFRHVYIPTIGEPNPYFVRPHEGRWGTDWTLHATGSPPTAWAEYCRHIPELVALADPTGGVGLRSANLAGLAFLELGDPVPRPALFALTYELERVLDVDAQRISLAAAGFDARDLYADDYGDCPALAQWAAAEGFEAIAAPSAAWRHPGGSVCAIFGPGAAASSARTWSWPALVPRSPSRPARTTRQGRRRLGCNRRSR